MKISDIIIEKIKIKDNKLLNYNGKNILLKIENCKYKKCLINNNYILQFEINDKTVIFFKNLENFIIKNLLKCNNNYFFSNLNSETKILNISLDELEKIDMKVFNDNICLILKIKGIWKKEQYYGLSIYLDNIVSN